MVAELFGIRVQQLQLEAAVLWVGRGEQELEAAVRTFGRGAPEPRVAVQFGTAVQVLEAAVQFGTTVPLLEHTLLASRWRVAFC